MLPQYVFFADGRFVIALIDHEASAVALIHPFDTSLQIQLQGLFADALRKQIQGAAHSHSAELIRIEAQHPWLKGLTTATSVPDHLRQTVVADALGLLFLEITDQCNERCIHCYASSSPDCHDFLSLNEIKEVLLAARALGRPFIQFTGGDPLIHRHLVEAVAYAHSLDFQGIEIYTNGLLLNQPLLDALLPYSPHIAFSLYSADAATHDRITQVSGSFQRTLAAMHRAQDCALKIRVGMAVMEENAGHEAAMLDFVQAEFCLDATSVRFDPVHETGRGSQLNTSHIMLQPSRGSHLPSDIKPHVVQQTDAVISETHTPEASSIQRLGKLAVCADGSVSPCIFNREHKLGNIREQSLAEILDQQGKVNGNLSPSITRWNHCQKNLSCADCQMVAYTLGANI